MRKYRTPMMVMPMRTYRALWIMELSTPRPFNAPPSLVLLLLPWTVVFDRLGVVTAGLGAALLPGLLVR